jgi:hypothetical protein
MVILFYTLLFLGVEIKFDNKPLFLRPLFPMFNKLLAVRNVLLTAEVNGLVADSADGMGVTVLVNELIGDILLPFDFPPPTFNPK